MIFRNKLTRLLSVLLLLMMSFLVGCDEATPTTDNKIPNNSSTTNTDEKTLEDDKKDEAEQQTKPSDEQLSSNEQTDLTEKKAKVNGNLEVHYIDVGQGDSILIKQGDSSMLIDAGDNAYGKRVVGYLKDQGITKLDYIIGTHPHADHIGGLDDVIKAFDVGAVIMPKVSHNTRTFEDVVLAIKDKGLKITTPKAGDSFDIGGASFTVVAPNGSTYEDLNDYSVITRLVYGENSFIFTGDAEEVSEGEVLASGRDIKSDVLKVGHHGSNTSTTDAFLDAVGPKYAVIQVGSENKYGHPTEKTISKLKEKNIEIYRNDLNGNVIAVSDGENITFNTTPVKISEEKPREVKQEPIQSQSVAPVKPVAPVPPKAPEASEPETELENAQVSQFSYIGNSNSHILHRSSCSFIPKESNRIYFASKDEGINAGYRGCKKCNP